MSEDRDRDRYYQGEGQFPGDRRGGYQERFPGDPHGIDLGPPTPHCGAFPGEGCGCPACLESAPEYGRSQPDHHAGLKSEILRLAGRAKAAEAENAELREAAVLVGRRHVAMRLRAETAEAALAEAGDNLAEAEAYAVELAEDRDRIHLALIEASVALAAAEGRADVAEERAAKASPEDRVGDRPALDAYSFTAAGHEYTVRRVTGPADAEFPGEGANITAGPCEFDHVSAAGLEILRLAADNAALREDRDTLHNDHEQGLEINAELTAALAALLGEPPPEPCSPGCRTPHLSAKASEAVRQALGRRQEMEMQLKDVLLEHAELLADIGELKAQEASAGNYVIRSMRELRKTLQARGLWRPAGQGEPGGGTAGSAIEAIEAIDRLTAENEKLRDEIEAELQGQVEISEGAGRMKDRYEERLAALQGELAEARTWAQHNAEGWEETFGRMGALAQMVIDARNEGRIEGLHQAQARIQDLVSENLKSRSDRDS